MQDRMYSLVNPTSTDAASGPPETAMDAEEAFRTVFPRDHPGSVRGAGRGHTQTSWRKQMEASQSASEIRSLKDQISTMKEMMEQQQKEREDDRMEMVRRMDEMFAFMQANYRCSSSFDRHQPPHDRDDGPDGPPSALV